jgi:hypothetical protein
MVEPASRGAPRRARRVVSQVCLAAAAQAGLTIAHFAHGARVYEDPSRYHVVAPALIAVALSLLVAGLYVRRPSRAVRAVLVAVVGLPFVAMFGLYHGGWSHAAKLLAFAAGLSPERLESIFDSPDFALPNDVVFELTGVATFAVGLVVALLLVRLLRSR